MATSRVTGGAAVRPAGLLTMWVDVFLVCECLKVGVFHMYEFIKSTCTQSENNDNNNTRGPRCPCWLHVNFAKSCCCFFFFYCLVDTIFANGSFCFYMSNKQGIELWTHTQARTHAHTHTRKTDRKADRRLFINLVIIVVSLLFW